MPDPNPDTLQMGRSRIALGLAAGLVLTLSFAAPAADDRPRRSLTQCLAALLCFRGLDFGDRFELHLESLTDARFVVAAAALALDGSKRTASKRLLTEEPDRRRLLALDFADGQAAARWSFTYHLAGVAAHDDQAVYRLPYPRGQAFRVLQGQDGDFSHGGAQRFAIDWAMPAGSPVLAARGGTVVGAFDGSTEGGQSLALYGRENFVWIRHDDGTVGQYLHLAPNSLAVGVGDRVVVGQALAKSGNTGFSSEPHLHFHVSAPLSEGPHAFETFPVRFALAGGRIGHLEEGRHYLAP